MSFLFFSFRNIQYRFITGTAKKSFNSPRLEHFRKAVEKVKFTLIRRI